MSKQKFGVSVDEAIVQDLDEVAAQLAHLDVSRSEVVEAILIGYSHDNGFTSDTVEEIVVRRRQAER